MKFKRWISALTVILFVFSSLFMSGCGDKKEREKKSDATMKVTAKANLGDGLDLQALLELVKREKTAEKIEEALNKDGSINNLDLNENGKIDYIKVHEYGEGDHRGLSFTVDMSNKDIQEIADVKFERAPDGKVVVQARGNENVYGQNHYYYDRWHAAEIAFLAYLFMPHPYYVSPYRYGYYPSYYAPRPIVSVNVYRTQRINTYVSKTTVQRSVQPVVKNTTVQSPNAGKTAPSVAARAPMSTTGSQRTLDKRDSSQPMATGGFGQHKQQTTSPTVGQSAVTPKQSPMDRHETQRTLDKRDSSQPMATGGFGQKSAPSAPTAASPRVASPSSSPSPRVASPSSAPRSSGSGFGGSSSGGGSSRGSSGNSSRR